MNLVKLGTIAAAAAALTLGAAPAKAQFVYWGLAGGVTMPSGAQADAQSSALHGGVILGFHAPATPFGLRGDLSLHHFPGKDIAGSSLAASTNMWISTMDVSYDLPLPAPVQPYALAGAGLYGSVTTVNGVPGNSSSTDWGMNLGAGVSFGRAFLETRWHHIRIDSQSVANIYPISLGFIF